MSAWVAEVVCVEVRQAVAVSFDELYEAQWWPMLRLAVGLVDEREVAEDVVQDAFAALFRRWHALHDRAAALAYLRVSVVNGSRSVLRRRQTARKHLRAVSDLTGEAADSTVILTAEHTTVREAMAKLPERQREVLTLRYVAGLADADIATATGLSESGVRSASSRALAALRTTLGALW